MAKEFIVYSEKKADFEAQVASGSVDTSQIGVIAETAEFWVNGIYHPLVSLTEFVRASQMATINGQSLIEGGDITIEGGESSGETNVQSDWNEGSSTSDAYIKNRTHCVSGITITNTGNYSVGTSVTRVYFKNTFYDLEVGVKKTLETGPPVYVTIDSGGILQVEGTASYIAVYPIIAVQNIKRLSEEFISEDIVRKSDIESIKTFTLDDMLAIKPSVRLLISAKNLYSSSMLYTYHPYITQYGDGELVLMRRCRARGVSYGQTLYNRTSGGWSLCMGAKAVSVTVEMSHSTPYVFTNGWQNYQSALNEICTRAMSYNRVLSDYPLLHMSQAITLTGQKALELLNDLYQQGTPDPQQLFGANHERIRLGVALRVKNPAFYNLYTDEEAGNKMWDTDTTGTPIPRYLYSNVAELILSAGSAKNLRPKLQVVG